MNPQEDEVARLIGVLTRANRVRVSRFWAVFGSSLGLACLVLLQVGQVVWRPEDPASGSNLPSWSVGALILGCLSLAGVAILRVVPLIRLRHIEEAACRLGKSGDRRAIGPLLDCLDITHGGRTLRWVMPALTDLLPLLQEADSEVLNARQRAALVACVHNAGAYWWIPTYGRNPAFIRGVLHAIGQLGIVGSYWDVQAVAQSAEWWAAPLQAEAKRCLRALRKRQETARRHGALLRPANPPESVGMLLRPAQGTGADSERILLRAVEPGS